MINEPDVVKKCLIMDLGLKNKKYYPFKYVYLQKEEEITDPKEKRIKVKESKTIKKKMQK